MRITGGKARSIPIECPSGKWVRPATDRMREAVFSAIGDDVQGAVFVDLFAGAGSYGLEAISRGAQAGVFVEQQRSAIQAITRNLEKVKRSAGIHEMRHDYSIQSLDVFKWLQQKSIPSGHDGYDLVLIDPPYDQVESSFQRLLMELTPLLSVNKGAWILFESPQTFDSFPPGYALRKTFGKGREDSRAMLLSWLPNR